MLNRRDLLKFAAGAAAGTAVTPLPWKLLDDTSIWTQNWSWIAKPPRGPETSQYTACTLCEAGCAVKARCIAGRPVSLAGVPGDVVSGGKLCAVGVAAHHLAYHPQRARGVLRNGRPARLEELVRAVRGTRGTVAIVDGRPGRAVSELYRRFAAAVPQGKHYAAEQNPLAEILGHGAWGLDLENVRTLLSFGVPVLDEWDAPGRVWAARAGFHLIQAEPRQSRTALLADLWLPARAGSSEVLAMAIGYVLLHDGMGEAGAEDRAIYNKFTPDFAAEATAIPASAIVDAAHRFAASRPCAAVGGGRAGAALNILTGGVGRRGNFLLRQSPWGDGAEPLQTAPDSSIAVLILDADVPWSDLRRKLRSDAVVVNLSPFPSGRDEWTVPSPVFLESLEDSVAHSGSTRATLRIAPAILPPPEGTVPIEALLTALAEASGVPAPGTVEAVLKERASSVHRARRGSAFTPRDGATKPVVEYESADQLWEALAGGARWNDEEPQETPVRAGRLILSPPQAPKDGLALVAAPWRGAKASSPLMSKLYQESALRPPPGWARVHPDTAARMGLAEGSRTRVETPEGTLTAELHLDASVMRDVLEVEGGRGSALVEVPARAGRV